MAKQEKSKKKRESVKLTEEQKKQIAKHQSEIRAIRYKGTFRKAYADIREQTVSINKMEATQEEKKQKLIEMLQNSLEELTGQDSDFRPDSEEV